jgi:hypothetical protein
MTIESTGRVTLVWPGGENFAQVSQGATLAQIEAAFTEWIGELRRRGCPDDARVGYPLAERHIGGMHCHLIAEWTVPAEPEPEPAGARSPCSLPIYRALTGADINLPVHLVTDPIEDWDAEGIYITAPSDPQWDAQIYIINHGSADDGWVFKKIVESLGGQYKASVISPHPSRFHLRSRRLVTGRRPKCRTIMVDGKPVLARSVGEPTEEDLRAVEEFARLLASKKVVPMKRKMEP